MASCITVSGVLDTESAARALRAVLAGSGIAHERISLVPSPGAPDAPAESAGHSSPNDSGQGSVRLHDRDVHSPGEDGAGAAHAEAMPGDAYLVSVDVRNAHDRMRVEALMAAAGARPS